MELRELKYFLAVTKEQSISKAAKALYITQPNLSRQMQNLEKEIGKQLFIRGAKKITLTETGQLLRKRAEEILELYNKTETELNTPITDISGDIYIGGGESHALKLIAKSAHDIQNNYPNIKYHIFSGDSTTIAEKLDKGLIDFGIFIEPFDLSKYNYLCLPLHDTWGVLMRKDSPLAEKQYITPEDLWNQPLICSLQSLGKTIITDWLLKTSDELNIVATYNLIYNASILVEQGLGYAIGLDKIINTSGNSNLCFKPLQPKLISQLAIAWKKYQVFPKCIQIFLNQLKENLK
ncbi:MAG: LysR family transcriptional regulator [Anaeroplasmataceae bacterium]|nr:LysR family transcriptional regulator [Anaeroplasmataceae bacterium]